MFPAPGAAPNEKKTEAEPAHSIRGQVRATGTRKTRRVGSVGDIKIYF